MAETVLRLLPVSGRTPAPATAGAMKAVLTDARFSDPDWIFERKLDGVRCVAIRDGAGVTLLSRNDLPMNGRYPEIAAALERQPARRFAIDGEVVAFRGSQTSFEALAQRGRHDVAIFLYVFDITWVDGEDVRALPLRERKRLLRETIEFDGPIRLTTHRDEIGEELFSEACRKGWEGLIAKRADSPYSTSRSKDWLKFKCDRSQELVVGGYTPPRGSREEFGALLVGHFDEGVLRYAGKVGTGFDDATLRDLGTRLAKLRRDDSPFAETIKEKGAVWADPELVAQVGFTEWTKAGRLRHPRFLGLRFDKAASEVVREA
jgi:bifunctional non-homologous end joining protein LigD